MKATRTILTLILYLGVAVTQAWSQDVPAHALDNVTIHNADGSIIEDGTIVWRDGIIKEAGSDADIPFDAYVIDGGDSLHVYPGFIDGLALWGSPGLPEEFEDPERPGDPGYERAGIQPQRQPAGLLEADDEAFEAAQKNGFTTAALGLKGFMLPGQLDLFFINGSNTDDYLYKESIALHAQFEEARGSAYPSTLMGIMARLRQLWFDATALKTQTNYYASNSDGYSAPQKDEVLESLFPVIDNRQPVYFVADTREHIERLFWLKDELEFDVVLVSGKEAYKKAGELERRNIPVLAGIDLPEKPEWKVKEEKAEEDTVKTKEEPEEITEEERLFREKQLAAWKADVDNIKKLMEAGVQVGYASNGMKPEDIGKHIKTLKKESSLTDEQILSMFTRNTADILGAGDRLGDLENGRIASFSVYTKPFAEEKARVKYSVSNGKLTEFEIKPSQKENENKENN